MPQCKIPTLFELCSKQLQVTNSNAFFKLPINELPILFKKDYIQPVINNAVQEEERKYWREVKEREEKIDDCSDIIRTNEPIAKCLAITSSVIFMAIHAAIYLAIKDQLTDSQEVIVVGSIVATAILGVCFGYCCLVQYNKCFVNCFYPSVPQKRTIDIEALGESPSNDQTMASSEVKHQILH